jgi:hypothetical protein
MMDRHKRRDPVAPPVFVRDEPDALKTKVDNEVWWGAGIALTLVALFMLIAVPLYINIDGRPRIAKAQADTRHIANAVSVYFAHCSGLPPADSSRTDCPVAAEPGGPHPLPKSLFVQQTNARGEVGGPFLKSWPRLPQGWTGAANSYAYTVLYGGRFLICAVGDSTGADSDGGAPTECQLSTRHRLPSLSIGTVQ